MAAVPDSVSYCGSTNMRRADHLLPLPCIGEPTAASRVSPGSSPARSEASGGHACYAADAEPDPVPAASAGRSTQMLLAMAAMACRGGPYGRRPASSYGSCAAAWSAGSLTHHRPASPSPICSPVSSRGEGGVREPHGGDDASFVTPRLEEEQEKLPDRADFMKPSATPRNIRLQTPRHPSLLDRRVGGADQVPPRFIHRATPARLMRRVRSSHNFRQRVGAIDAINEWRLPKVSEEEDEAGDQKDWQTETVLSRISSARDWNFESNGAFEGSNHGDAFDYSDGENYPDAVRRMERRLPNSVFGPKGNFVHAKLVALKDAQVSKLIEKLKRKEADIDDWQKNKIAKARQKMRQTDVRPSEACRYNVAPNGEAQDAAHEEELTAQVRERICSRGIGPINVSDVLSIFPDISVAIKRILDMCSALDKKKLEFVLDSGATHHICNDEKIMRNLKNIKVEDQVTVASCDGTDFKAERMGSVVTKDFKLSQVGYTPQVPYNVVSVGQLASQGLLITTGNRQFNVYSIDEARLVGEGFLQTKKESDEYIFKTMNWEFSSDEGKLAESGFDSSETKQDWVIDTGCAKHMVSDEGSLRNAKTERQRFEGAAGPMWSTHKGTATVGGLELKGVFCCPELIANLISGSMLDKDGYRTTFGIERCTIVQKDGLKQKGVGILRKSRLYCLDLDAKEDNLKKADGEEKHIEAEKHQKVAVAEQNKKRVPKEEDGKDGKRRRLQ
ncbi:hypothetical protein ACP70R_044512 [Stipagrostis hirtigluma subsp. patula]